MFVTRLQLTPSIAAACLRATTSGGRSGSLGMAMGTPAISQEPSAGIKIAYAGLTDAASIQVSTAKSSSGT
jgi:hypothetical protein